jgi:hypothetical protein
MSYPYTETLVAANDMIEGLDYLFAGNKYLTTAEAIERFKRHRGVYFRRGTRIFSDCGDTIANVTDCMGDTDKFLAVDILRRFESR